MNQGKLEVVKQQRTRVNTDSLGISELKWTGMGKFNSNDSFVNYEGCSVSSKGFLPTVVDIIVI